MKLFIFFLLTIQTLAATAGTLTKRDASPVPLPAKFTLVASMQGLPGIIWPEAHLFNGSAYIGNSKYNGASERLVFSGGDSAFSFTSFHSSPNGGMNFLIYPLESRAVAFSTPHSGVIPAGATKIGFEVLGDQLAWNSRMEWQACPAAGEDGIWTIFWDGAGTAKCVPVGLYVYPVFC